MKKFVYDIESGHYIYLNEDDNSLSDVAQNQNQENSQNQNQENNNSQQSISALPIESDETLTALNKALSDKKVIFDKDMTDLNNQLALAQQDISKRLNSNDKKLSNYKYDPAQVDPVILNIQNKIVTKQNEWNIFNQNIQKQILARKKELSALTKAESIGVPYKVRYMMNESAVSKCKIYIDSLTGEDKPIFNKYSLNKCFKNTNLVYGKDKKRYFVVIIDQADVDEMYQALLDFGYEFDEIQSVILSGLMDRSHMV